MAQFANRISKTNLKPTKMVSNVVKTPQNGQKSSIDREMILHLCNIINDGEYGTGKRQQFTPVVNNGKSTKHVDELLIPL